MVPATRGVAGCSEGQRCPSFGARTAGVVAHVTECHLLALSVWRLRAVAAELNEKFSRRGLR